MSNSAWQQEVAPTKPIWSSIWLQVSLAVSACILAILLLLGLQTRYCRVSAWQGFRSVMAQIRSDSDAKALYHRSPDLLTRFPDESRFLEYLKTYQSVIQEPPIAEPLNAGERYHVFSLPTSVSVRYQFEDGTTFSVEINSPGLFRSYPERHESLGHFHIQATRMLTNPQK